MLKSRNLLIFLCLFACSLAHGKPTGKKTGAAPPPPAEMHQQKEQASLRQFELRTAPIAFVARWLTLEALFRVNPHWAVGPSFVYYGDTSSGSMFWLSYQGRAVGIVATHYLRGAGIRGWYGTGRYHFESFTHRPHAKSEELHYKGHALLLSAGYRFVFLKNFFVMPGLGVKLGLYERTETNFSVPSARTRNTKPNHFLALPYLEAKLGVEF